MNIKFVSNDYIFRYGACIMTAKMMNASSSPVIEFFLDHEKIYYYLIPEADIDTLDDLAIVHKAVEKMRMDKERWIADCSPYLDNIDHFILYERSTIYKIEVNALMHQYATLIIMEENNSRFMLTLRDEMSGLTMITHLHAESRSELIDTMDSVARMIIEMLKPFREKQEFVILNSFGTYFSLRQSNAIVDNYEFTNKKGGH